MKTTVDGINGPVEVDDPLGPATGAAGNAANQVWRTVQAWKGREAPSDISYEVQKHIAEKVKGALGAKDKPAIGRFTEAEQVRTPTRGPREQG